MLTQSLEKFVVDVVVVQCHPIGVFQRDTFGRRERIGLGIQLGDFLFAEVVICTLQKTRVESREAIVVPRDL